MTDTPDDFNKTWLDRIMQRTPAERVAMGCSMSGAAKKLAELYIRQQHPEYSKTQVRRALFTHLYRNDFLPAEREKILDAIAPTY